ncbi:hypothetical protein SAMN00777080_5051 [Aquiflexum balticum DSM 16537]|uniref:Uncharacterized protein n=1 Tax=Aquiflexum balticum DSM 16537 TaxID=758820 RepID=A0A1W2HCX4_9BACT|nr:hypothetical protein [Aquiflexum balticum]SMD46366.1 hypothetical protein SAMN00777080_5051 [Aquiflexum balticum DSM 16537]
MKHDLERHLKYIFNSLDITVTFDVYDCKIDILPDWAKCIELTNEYFACCQDLSIRNRLQVFIGRNIYENGNYIYWFEGEVISITESQSEVQSIDLIEFKSVEFLKIKTRLPVFLDDFIFSNLNAIYAPDFQRFDYNLDLTGEEILKYLGTYFPRSYAESYCIFDNIFQNLLFQQNFSNKTSLNILSIGSGTGGDIIGLLTIIEKYFHSVKEVKIWAFDGNIESLDILIQIIDRLKSKSSKKIFLKTLCSVIGSISHFQNEDVTENNYDFILSFKFICEIIAKGNGRLDNSYYDFTQKFLPLLSKDGLFVLLDVTTKPLHNTYYPILMNKQINKALEEIDEFECLFSLSSSAINERSLQNYFQQKTFTVTHSKRSNDKSRVAFRIIVSKD